MLLSSCLGRYGASRRWCPWSSHLTREAHPSRPGAGSAHAHLGDGRLTLPEETLARHGVSRADLEQARDTPGTRALLTAELTRARAALQAARALPGLVVPGCRAFVRAFVELEVLTADAALRAVPEVLRAPVRPATGAALRVLLGEWGRRGR
ncbi:hypothetical protein GCM10010218_41110 [Streptomyces mashuensis]|uniref:Uncharacterized protein n=1 Tax=Streptomyces mashuensis TaxID=33904 RepID=A0A919B6K3_9ACTN|nr:squalene/phytoene synthase family protein [Streptomyces mashuensis]GHF55384.1 hypothetical protein GCM10010218_41110 [Streptomyces mashuensis]